MSSTPSNSEIVHWHVFREWRLDDGTLICDSAPLWSEASARYVATQIQWDNLERRGILICHTPVLGTWEDESPLIYAPECQALCFPHPGRMPEEAEVIP